LPFIDADTLDNNQGPDIRIEGFNAPEKSKIITRDGEERFVQGQQGAEETEKAVARIAEEGGYNIIGEGEEDSFGRTVAPITNAAGERLDTALFEAGAVKEGLYTSSENVEAAHRGRLSEQILGQRRYADIVNEEMGDYLNQPVLFKQTAENENEYRQAVVEVIAAQQGLNLANEEEYRQAYNMALSGNFDARSIPFAGIDFRTLDRDIMGAAYNQKTESFFQGWKGMTTGLAGFAELVGVGIGDETLASWGAENVEEGKDALRNAPLIRNLDFRDIDDIYDGFEFFMNNVAMTAPYMITLTAGHLASPLTAGASIPIAYSSIAGVHAGNVWNDIEGPKGRSEAAAALTAGVAMATLDRIGMKGVLAPSSLLTKEGRDQVIKAYASQNNVSITEATKIISKETKSVIKGTIEGMGTFASDHINNSKALRELLSRAGQGALIEGATEASQEGLGYLTSSALSEGGLERNFNPNEFSSLLASAAVAGGAIGGAFSTAGGFVEAGDRYAMQKGLMLGRVDRLNPIQQLKHELGNQGSVVNITDEYRKKTETKAGGNQTKRKAEKGKQTRSGVWTRLRNPTKFLPELYRAAGTTAFRPELQRRSAAVRKIAALTGQTLGKLYNGRDVQAQEAKIRSDLLDTIDPRSIPKRFGLSDKPSDSKKISDMIRRYIAAGGDKAVLADDKEVLKNYDAIEKTIQDLQTFSDADYSMRDGVYRSQGVDRAKLVYDPNAWLNRQGWDWSKVRQNKEEWFAWMRKNATMPDGSPMYSEEGLNQLYLKVSNNENATDFSIVEGIEQIPGQLENGPPELSSKPGYEKFANTDIIQNAINTANQTAKYAAYTQYFGAGGKYLDELLLEAEQEGLSRDEVNEVAFHTVAIVNAGTGNYNPIENKKVVAFQRAGSFYATTIGLPLAALSSVPEFVMLLWQARNSNEVMRQVGIFTGELVGALKNVAEMKVHPLLSNVPRMEVTDRESTRRLIDSGLYPDDATVATRYGLGETDVSKAWFMQQFFKYTLIAGETQLQRAMAAAGVDGFVSDRIRILLAVPEGTKYNQDQLDAYMQLNDLGMDVEKYLEVQRKYLSSDKDINGQTPFDKFADRSTVDEDIRADFDFVVDTLDTVTWYFVNDRIQNPQAFNRPLFYQDPHFQLFVQFNGFISTFTGNIVPRLWNDYLKNGSPRMKYNTFAMIVTMIGVAGASQWLKDFIKFGGSTPYLSNEQLVQRAIMASGVLGTGERILQMASPLYQDRDQNLASRFFGETIGGAPTARILETAAKTSQKAIQGDYEGFLQQGTKLVPVLSAYTPGRNFVTDVLQGQPPSSYPFNKDEGE
jgi:hypothetical protein